MKTKPVKPNSLFIAAVVLHDGGNWQDLIQETHLTERDGDGFCGFVQDYYHDRFHALYGKWQSKMIPAGAVEKELDRLRDDATYMTFTLKELKEVAKDNLLSRLPYAVKYRNMVLLQSTDTTGYAIGINASAKMFNDFIKLLASSATITVHSTEKILDNIQTNLADLYHVVDSQGNRYEYALHSHGQKWLGKNTGIILRNDGAVRLSLDHIRGSCQDAAVLCTYAVISGTHPPHTLGVSSSGKKLAFSIQEDGFAFDFTLSAQDIGEAAGNAVYWRDALEETAKGVMALSSGTIESILE